MFQFLKTKAKTRPSFHLETHWGGGWLDTMRADVLKNHLFEAGNFHDGDVGQEEAVLHSEKTHGGEPKQKTEVQKKNMGLRADSEEEIVMTREEYEELSRKGKFLTSPIDSPESSTYGSTGMEKLAENAPGVGMQGNNVEKSSTTTTHTKTTAFESASKSALGKRRQDGGHQPLQMRQILFATPKQRPQTQAPSLPQFTSNNLAQTFPPALKPSPYTFSPSNFSPSNSSPSNFNPSTPTYMPSTPILSSLPSAYPITTHNYRVSGQENMSARTTTPLLFRTSPARARPADSFDNRFMAIARGAGSVGEESPVAEGQAHMVERQIDANEVIDVNEETENRKGEGKDLEAVYELRCLQDRMWR